MNNEYIALSGSKTQTGQHKEFNTDASIDFSIEGGHVYVLSDGRNGENGHAALASKLTVESIKKYFSNKTYKNIANALTNAVSYANYAVFEQANKDSKYAGMGATLAVLIYHQGKCYYAYAGDSRVYILNQGELKALTKDHLPESEMITKEEPTVLIGKNKDIKFGVCINPINVELEHKFLLCTDGLSDCLNNEEIADILKDEDTSADHMAMLVAEKASLKEHEDCLSVYTIGFGKENLNVNVDKKSSSLPKSLQVILFAIVGASIIGFGAYKGFVYLSQTEKSPSIIDEPVVPEANVEVEIATAEPEEQSDAVEDAQVASEPLLAEVKKEIAIVETQNTTHKHQVIYGENLYRLGLRYNVSQAELLRINGEKASNLVANSYIEIPIKAKYKVKSGESWSVVSDRYNVKIASIANASKVDVSTSLKEGQLLIIPLK